MLPSLSIKDYVLSWAWLSEFDSKLQGLLGPIMSLRSKFRSAPSRTCSVPSLCLPGCNLRCHASQRVSAGCYCSPQQQNSLSSNHPAHGSVMSRKLAIVY